MRLLTVEINGFRRLNEVKMNLDEPVAAIVGPNEAGKSSLLDALRSLNDEEPIAHRDQTRGLSMEDDAVVVRCRYLLDKEEREVLSNRPELAEARYFLVVKRVDGTLGSDVQPIPERDLEMRKKAQASLGRVRASKQVAAMLGTDDNELRESFDAVADLLASPLQTMRPADVETLREFGATLRGPSWSATAQKLGTKLEELAAYEESGHPRDWARDEMLSRRPLHLLFGSEERELREAYDLDAVAASPPIALENLASVAGLDLAAVARAVDQDDFAAKESAVREANAVLELAFADAWKQSQVSVQLSVDGRTLRVFASGEGRTVTSVAERSEGLRTFIALLCFLAAREVADAPILLIDEAEQHLHYDAQADLVRMLGRQRAAIQVVYTTHSAGCLPQDLGAVRVVAPGPTAERSVARNAFWEEDSVGFDSLLFAMGASTFAFAATRRALLAEGPSEVILLPRMFREATGLADPGFQVAPGLASLDQATAQESDMIAARVAYLVDSDDGGKANAKILKRARIPEERIARLTLPGAANASLEDLLDAGQYLRAVNEELRRSHGDAIALKSGDIPASGRTAAVRDACSKLGVAQPNKVAVARRLSGLESDVPILSSAGKKSTLALHGQILKILDLPAGSAEKS
jgi:hypothetical protein